MRKKRKTVRKKRSGCTKVILLMVLIAAVIVCVRGIDAGKSAEQIVQKYADRHNIYMSEYPDEMIQLLASNKETKKFVLEYPEKKILLRKSVWIKKSEGVACRDSCSGIRDGDTESTVTALSELPAAVRPVFQWCTYILQEIQV